MLFRMKKNRNQTITPLNFGGVNINAVFNFDKKVLNYLSFPIMLVLHSTCYHTNKPKRISNFSNSPFPLVYKYNIVVSL
jgi:hypothetical protein